MKKTLLVAALSVAPLLGTADLSQVHAQVGGMYPQRQLPTDRTPIASLKDYLNANLRATLPEQQQFIAAVVQQVNLNRLDTSLPIALSRYAQRQNASFPFPFFERAMRHEAAKRGVNLPAVAVIQSSRTPLGF